MDLSDRLIISRWEDGGKDCIIDTFLGQVAAVSPLVTALSGKQQNLREGLIGFFGKQPQGRTGRRR